jgi:hypothetical protein
MEINIHGPNGGRGDPPWSVGSRGDPSLNVETRGDPARRISRHDDFQEGFEKKKSDLDGSQEVVLPGWAGRMKSFSGCQITERDRGGSPIGDFLFRWRLVETFKVFKTLKV